MHIPPGLLLLVLITGLGACSGHTTNEDVCEGMCQPTCTDAIQNDTETGIDCGGSCPACDNGKGCSVGVDCVSGVCTSAICQAPTCTDSVKNGTEDEVDCGGSCRPCKDPYFSSIVLLLHMNGADGSTSFIDVKGHAVTTEGNAKISTAMSKFGGASGYFDGADDCVLTAESADFDFNGRGPFTIEAWVNGTGTFWNNGFVGMILSIKNGTQLRLWIADVLTWDSLGTVAGVVTAGWHHVALSYDGTTYRVFVDGEQSFSVAGTLTRYAPAQGVIGKYSSNIQPFFNGYIDEVRVTKGVARYTASFTPPATEFADN